MIKHNNKNKVEQRTQQKTIKTKQTHATTYIYTQQQ